MIPRFDLDVGFGLACMTSVGFFILRFDIIPNLLAIATGWDLTVRNDVSETPFFFAKGFDVIFLTSNNLASLQRQCKTSTKNYNFPVI